MSEENKSETVTKEEIEKLQKEIQAKESVTLDQAKKELAETVKKEIKQEQDLEKIKEANEQLQKKLEEQQKESEEKLKKIQEDLSAKMDDLANSQKSVKTNENPFEKTEETSGVNYRDPKIIENIEEESRRAFIEKYGLDQSFGRPN